MCPEQLPWKWADMTRIIKGTDWVEIEASHLKGLQVKKKKKKKAYLIISYLKGLGAESEEKLDLQSWIEGASYLVMLSTSFFIIIEDIFSNILPAFTLFRNVVNSSFPKPWTSPLTPHCVGNQECWKK